MKGTTPQGRPAARTPPAHEGTSADVVSSLGSLGSAGSSALRNSKNSPSVTHCTLPGASWRRTMLHPQNSFQRGVGPGPRPPTPPPWPAQSAPVGAPPAQTSQARGVGFGPRPPTPLQRFTHTASTEAPQGPPTAPDPPRDYLSALAEARMADSGNSPPPTGGPLAPDGAFTPGRPPWDTRLTGARPTRPDPSTPCPGDTGDRRGAAPRRVGHPTCRFSSTASVAAYATADPQPGRRVRSLAALAPTQARAPPGPARKRRARHHTDHA